MKKVIFIILFLITFVFLSSMYWSSDVKVALEMDDSGSSVENDGSSSYTFEFLGTPVHSSTIKKSGKSSAGPFLNGN